jgi:hypothetical protein
VLLDPKAQLARKVLLVVEQQVPMALLALLARKEQLVQVVQVLPGR